MNNDQIQAALEWRYATKKYDSTRSIPEADWKTLETALVQTPSSYGLQPFRFLVIENPTLREQLKEVSWGQTQITDASKLVVLLSKEKVAASDVRDYIQRISNIRGIPQESLRGFEDLMVSKISSGLTPDESLAWARKQTYIALGFLIETAALLKIDATPMEGLDPAAYDRILGLQGSGYTTSVAVALGYRHTDDATQSYKKVRQPASSIIQYR